MAKLTEPSADEIEVKREILTRYIELCEALPGGRSPGTPGLRTFRGFAWAR